MAARAETQEWFTLFLPGPIWHMSIQSIQSIQDIDSELVKSLFHIEIPYSVEMPPFLAGPMLTARGRSIDLNHLNV